VTPEPTDSSRRAENLRAVMTGLMTPPAKVAAPAAPTADPPGPGAAARRRTWWGSLGVFLALVLGKLKFLGVITGVLKLKTFATVLLSIAAYATQWGWAFAAGFVLLILVHEAGHAIVMHREGIPASAPVFIPFVGAFIAMRGRPRNAYVEAKVGFGGPLLGSLASWATLALGLGLERPLLVGLGHAGVLLNLFNLVPVSPLDGGRIAGVFSRPFWVLGYAIGIAVVVFTGSGILALVLLVGLVTLYQRLRHPVPGYHDVPPASRRVMGLAYLVLVVGLALTLPMGVPGSTAH